MSVPLHIATYGLERIRHEYAALDLEGLYML